MSIRHPHIRFQYEPLDIENFREAECDNGAKMEGITNPDVLKIWDVFHSTSLKRAFAWADRHQKDALDKTYVIDTDDGYDLEAYNEVKPDFILNKRSLNEVPHINLLLGKANEALADGGYLLCHARTATLERELILHTYPLVIRRLKTAWVYFWHRVCPKMPLIKRLYFKITDGRHRSFHRIEMMGRMCRAGFQIVDEEFIHGEFFVIGRKVREPKWDEEPKCGPVIKLKRVGKDGKYIGVYKFRTMYSYSEYLQDYLYLHGGLQEGGKFKEDCRINFWGKWMRPIWLDELPMLVNWIKGQMKLVGVRPLSQQYFNLYTPEMRALRIKVKPGLIPPFYYDRISPKTIEDVQASERRYIEAYLKHPLRTDIKYFWGSIGNILFRHKHSN